MTEDSPLVEPTDLLAPPRVPSRRIRALTAGAAMAAIPIAGLYLYVRAERASNVRDMAMEKAVDYDIEKLQQIDPALIHYHESRKIETGMTCGRALALDRSGNLLVAGDTGIRFILPGGDREDWNLMVAPNAIAVSENGDVYAAMKDHVEVLGSDGVRKSSWPLLGEGAYLTGLAVAGDNVYLADSGRRVIIRTDLSGKTLSEIGRANPARGIPGLLLPSPHLGVAVAADASIWVNNAGRHQLENYKADGTLERFWGVSGTSVEAFSGCCNPAAFVLLPDGSFITAEKGIARVKHYRADGKFESVVAGPASFDGATSSLSIVVDSGGRIYVLERGTGRVHVFERNAGGAT